MVIVQDVHNQPVQAGGNLCLYSGTGPGNNHGQVWISGKTGGEDDHDAFAQDDGHLAVYDGTGPADNDGLLWSTRGVSTHSVGEY